MAKFPCLNCNSRTLGCHSTCKKYLEAKQLQTAEQAKLQKDQAEERQIEAVLKPRRKKKG